MWTLVQRVVVPVLLLGAGIASTIYGAFFHVIPVVQEREEEVSLPVESPFGPAGAVEPPPAQTGDAQPGMESPPDRPDALAPGMEPPLDQPPGFPAGFAPGILPPPGDGLAPGMPPPFGLPAPPPIKVIQTVVTVIEEPEPRVVREVSVGGVTLALSGEIKRTYSGEEGPSLCPT